MGSTHNPKKRTSRSPALLDWDDEMILLILRDPKLTFKVRKDFERELGKDLTEIQFLRLFLGLSLKSISSHLQKLQDFELIDIKRGQGQDYRNKLPTVTLMGEIIAFHFSQIIKKTESYKKDFGDYAKKERNGYDQKEDLLKRLREDYSRKIEEQKKSQK